MTETSGERIRAESSPAPRISRKALFLGFLKIGLLGFGGVASIARHVIVEDRAWLSERDYAAVLGVGQILPGANTVNAAVMIGDRFHGASGAAAAVLGLMAMPIVILIALAALYARFSALPDVRVAIAGTAAAAAGMVIGTALKMARRLKPTRIALLFGLLAFAACGLLQLSLVLVVIVLAPLSVAAAFLERRA
ncbi:MAG TPA: chromate transporter [Alphaproteobacteria bacterium]|nr:chromate transporter [Alphaproteobacteria bacterium]